MKFLKKMKRILKTNLSNVSFEKKEKISGKESYIECLKQMYDSITEK